MADVEIILNMMVMDIHDNVIRWVQRVPIDTLEQKEFWDGIN